LMIGVGFSEVVICGAKGVENAALVNGIRLGTELRRLSIAGFEYSCRCIPAPEWRNMLAGQEQKGRPKLWGAFHSKECAIKISNLKKGWKAQQMGALEQKERILGGFDGQTEVRMLQQRGKAIDSTR
jgi:hypothetical protein